jgi:hypothetical protein
VIPNVLFIVFTIIQATGGTIDYGWSIPINNEDGSLIVLPMTYDIYRSRAGGPYSRIQKAWTKIKFNVKDVKPGTEDCFEIVVTESGQPRSEMSAPTCIIPT